MTTAPTIHIRAGKARYSDGCALHESHALDLTGRIALALVERFGLITSQRDGEDSAGRAAYGLLPTEAVVARACEIAARFVAEADSRGWLHALPVPETDPAVED